MRLRATIAICVVMSPFLCAAQSVRDENIPICDPSHPNPGSVNILTNTKGIDFGPYLEVVKKQVKRRWYSLIPSGAIFKSGCVSVQFKILKNGDIADVHYVSSSGDPQLDRAASAAIEWPEATPPSLPPLPREFEDDHLELRFIFSYNLGPAGSNHGTVSQTPAIDEAAMAPALPANGSTLDFSRIADNLKDAQANVSSDQSTTLNATSTPEVQIVSGRLVRKTDPRYPKEARKSKTRGIVVLEATIEKNGSVTDLAIISGDLILADAAVDAVREWRFEPYTASEHPIQVRQQLSFNFDPGRTTGELDPQLAQPTVAKGLRVYGRPKASAGETFYAVGHGVTAPKVTFAPDPPYSETARKNKYQGTCLLSLVVGADGQPHDIQVVRALGMGLDERAVSTVEQWKFQPGTKDGNPVAVNVVIEVAFHLY
jgi:TonB family protein